MLIRRFSDLKLIKQEWKGLYEKNPVLTPFQSYEWNLLLQTKFRHPINWLIRVLRGKARIEYWIFTENEEIIIAPLIVYEAECKIYIFGQQDMSDYLSFIFHEKISEEFLANCIQTLRKRYSRFSIVFDRINESNIKMKNACIKVDSQFQEKKCVKIRIVDQLTTKIKSDSRRYWKQALKRIEIDSLPMNFMFNQTVIDHSELSFLLDHYLKRRANKFDLSNLQKILMHILKFLHNITGNKNDMVSLFYTNNTDPFVSKCLINNYTAAYMLCTLRNETLYVLRISIDDKFSIYRPGILLIVETVNYLNRTFPSIKFLDFSRGDESYKLNYGGLIHYNYCFIF